MKLRILFAAALACCVISGPAAAQGLSAYGVWGDGHQLKKSNASPAFGGDGNPSMLGGPPAVASALPQTGKAKELLQGGPRPSIAPMAPQKVAFNGGYGAGSVVIDQSAKRLYYVLGSGQAYAYPVAVGKTGFGWTGTEKVSKIVNWPDWTPPEEMRHRKPHLPLKMTGGLNNPLGAKAIYLGNTLYRIHGTNDFELHRHSRFIGLHPHAQRPCRASGRPRFVRHHGLRREGSVEGDRESRRIRQQHLIAFQSINTAAGIAPAAVFIASKKLKLRRSRRARQWRGLRFRPAT